MVAVGGLYALVAPLDGGLGRTTGALAAALVDFAGGTFILLAVVLGQRRLRDLAAVRTAPRHLLLGGVCGAFFVTMAVVTVRTLGAGGVAAATITGQLIASLALDRRGAFGLAGARLSTRRVAGASCLLVGTLLIAIR